MEKEQSLATVKPISAAKAAPWFNGLKYPAGLEEHANDIVRSADCFEINTDAGCGIFAIQRRGVDGRTAWINGARARGGIGWLPLGLGIIETAAKAQGFNQIGLQTARRGLVRKAEKLGYEVTGYILTKKIT